MNYKLILFFLPLLIVGKLFSQATPYLVKEFPSVFSEVEDKLQQEKFDAVLRLCSGILEKEDNPKIKGIAYFYQGEAAALMDNFQFADLYLSEAVKSFETAAFKKGLAMAYCKQGDLFYYQRRFSKADSLYNKSIGVSRGLELNGVLADIYQNKAVIYADSLGFESSVNVLKKALNKAFLLKEQDRINSIINEINFILIFLNKSN